jgi:site-specific recombinase XerD
MHQHLDAFARHLGRRSPRTAQAYRSVLERFFRGRDAADGVVPSTAAIEAFLARPTEGGRRTAPATRNQALAAWRSFGKFAVRDLGWPSNPAAAIAFEREPPRSPAVLSVGEVGELFLAAAKLPEHERARASAVVALTTQGGLRVAEFARLRVEQVDPGSSLLLGVKGKGGSVQDIVLGRDALAIVSAWVRARAEAYGPHGPLFPSLRDPEQPVSVRTHQRLFVRLRTLMGTKKRVTPHTGRHSLATNLLTLGTDLATVADTLRDSDVNTVRRFYLHLIDERRRAAAERIAVSIPRDVVLAARMTTDGAVDVRACHVGQVLEDACFSSILPELPENDVDVQHGLSDAA